MAFGPPFFVWGLAFTVLPEYSPRMNDNLITLDLTRFTPADIQKLEDLRKKVVLLRRWCRFDRVIRDGHEMYALYSGDNGPQAYASYVISRRENGSYALEDARSAAPIADGRTIDAVIEALPEDFYFTKYLT